MMASVSMEEIHRRWIPQTTQGEGRMGLTDKAIGLRKLGLKWLQDYLQSRGNSNQVFTNHNYPCCLSVLTLEHIEEEHMLYSLRVPGRGCPITSFGRDKMIGCRRRLRKKYSRFGLRTLGIVFQLIPSSSLVMPEIGFRK